MTDADVAAVKDTVRHHWDNRAPSFDEGPTHGLLDDEQRAAWTARVDAWAGVGPIDALDVGCGTGFFALLLTGLGHRTTGVDMAPAMLELARQKAASAGLDTDFRFGDAEQLPFPDGSFHLVIERHVIWTLPRPTVALAEWARILRPGGHLVLVEGQWDGSKHDDYQTIRSLLPLYGGSPAADLAALVASTAEGGGFSTVEIEPLMDAGLWGGPPERDRYALHARRR